MKKHFFIAFVFIVGIFVSQSFTILPPKAGNGVLIYGLVYNTACNGNSRTAYFHVTAYSDSKNYMADMKKMREALKEKFTNAVHIHVGSSQFEYGSNASNFFLIHYKVKGTTCNKWEYVAKFGKTATEAREKAEEVAKSASNGEWNVKESKYW